MGRKEREVHNVEQRDRRNIGKGIPAVCCRVRQRSYSNSKDSSEQEH